LCLCVAVRVAVHIASCVAAHFMDMRLVHYATLCMFGCAAGCVAVYVAVCGMAF